MAAALAVLAGFSATTIVCADPPPGFDGRIVFADEFSGTSLDTVKWAPRYEWGSGNTHNHNAYMEPENVVLDDGILALVATREPAPSGRSFTSGVISSHGTFRLSEGYIEARIKMPTTRGSWPAFWMLRSGWPPEIDIMENPLHITSAVVDQYYTNYHFNGGSNGSYYDTNLDLGAEFHNFGLEWSPSVLRFYFDGVVVKTETRPEVLSQFYNMYLILNYAVGGWPVPGSTNENPLPPPTTEWPEGHVDRTLADWIRVWQRAPSNNTSTWTYAGGSAASWDAAGNWSGIVPNYERQQVVLPTLPTRSAIELRWNNSRTIGNLTLEGGTAYTLGQAGGAVESLMFANDLTRVGLLNAGSGNGGHVINARIDLWTDVIARNESDNPLTINGDIIGQARQPLPNTRMTGGAITFLGPGKFVLNGNGYYQRSTLVSEAATVVIHGSLYADANTLPDTRVTVDLGATLEVNSMDFALGGLPADADRVLLNGGTVRVTSSSNWTRGFTIGGEGAVIETNPDVTLRITGTGGDIVHDTNATLTLTGAGTGRLQASLAGAGSVRKTGAGTWLFAAANSYAGETIVDEGTLSIIGTTGGGATFVNPGGALNGTGSVLGSLVVHGALSPGTSTGTLHVLGNYTQHADGSLHVDIRGSAAGMYDLLSVKGAVTLDGVLNIALLDGFVPSPGDLFPILNADSLTGSLQLAGDASGFSLLRTEAGLALFFGPLPVGDYNRDGRVDLADYTAWKAAYGDRVDSPGDGADGNADGRVDAGDFVAWRNNLGANVFGETDSSARSAQLPVVPEPAAVWPIMIVAAAALRPPRPKRPPRESHCF